MNTNMIVKKVALATTENIVGFVAYFGVMALVKKVTPKLLEPNESNELKDQMIWLIQTLGMTIAVAVITSIIAGAAKSAVENKFFSTIDVVDIS